MTLESDVAAIASRSLWLRARDLAGASGSVVSAWPDYAGVRVMPQSMSTTPTGTVSTDAPPLSSKSVYFNGSYGLAVGRVVQPVVSTFASSTFPGAGLSSDNVFDGVPSTEWASNLTTSGHVGAQFATAFAANEYRVQGRAGAAATQTPSAWTFEGSNDGSAWTTLDTRTGQNPSLSPATYTFTNATTYAYYRLNVSAVQSGGGAVGLTSLTVHGTGAPFVTVHGGTASEVWAVVKATTTLSSAFYKAGTGVESFYPYSNGQIYDDFGANSRPSFTPTTSVTVWHTVRFQMDAGTKRVWINGVLQDTATGLSVSWPDVIMVGKGETAASANAATVKVAEIVAFNDKLSSADATKVSDYLTAQHFTASSSSPVSVAAPVMGVVEAVPAPVVSAGTKVTVAAPTLGVVEAVPAPTVSAGAGVSVAAPALGVTTTVPAPSVVMGGGVTVSAPVLGVSVAVPAPGVMAGGSVTVDAPALAVTLAVAAPVVSTSSTWTPGDTLLLSAPSPVHAALASFEVYTPPTDVLVLSAPVVCEATLRIHPVPVPVPAGISDRPIVSRRHLMSPKTEATPRKMGDPLRPRAAGTDGYVYPIEENDLGRLRVFASGIDITYLAGAPTTVSEWSFAKPFGPQAASFTVPLPEWNYPGPYGNMPIFWGDAPIEICLEDSLGTLHHLWEGYTGEESDTAAPGQTGVTWNCEGTFQQAAHWLMDPPAVMDERDYGHVIADALNSVPNRRWAKIKRFTTGKTTTDRGDSAQSVLAYVADLLGKVFDDNGNQLGLHRVGPYAYQLAWNNTVVDPDWSFTKGSPGFNMTLARPHNARRDMVFGRGIAPDGGFWMNRKFPGLASASPPVYPMASAGTNISVGTRDSDTVTGNGVTTWQRRMRELGYPVTVDGVMNSADTKWVTRIQEDRGITVDGSLGPQTWSATWEGGAHLPETTTVRLPLDSKPNAREFDRDASGAIVRPNPLFDKQKILHATPEVDFGTNIKKSTATPMAGLIRNREASPGYVGSLTVTGVDPKEAGSSRFFINEGDNILIDGHHNGIVVQVSDVTHTPTTTRMTVDSGARGQAVVDAVLTRRRDLRRSPSGKSTRVTDRGALNASQLGQYESESPAGKYSRTAINGDAGLWTVRCIYVAEQGLARFRLSSSPRAEIVTLICGKRITANQAAAICPDPLSSRDGWYDAERELTEKFGLVNIAGTPGNPGGYYPREKTGENVGPLTGVQAAGNLSMKSQRGGFFWVAVFTSRSTFVEGEFEPEVSTA